MAANCLRDPQLLEWLAEAGPRRTGDWRPLLQAATREALDGADFSSRLRRLRRREMSRIAWRDLAGCATLDASLAELSDFADASIATAVAYAHDELKPRFGEPRGTRGDIQELVVLAMGKLGGRELNFSSDVDLVFLYPGPGRTDGPRSLTCEEYFARLCRRLIHYLDAATDEGFVFRVDARLRPFGESGPLAMSFGAFEAYLQQHGRDWERYAYVKARPVTGTDDQGALFQSILRPFVYRRYLDYGVFASLRRMKALIERESSRRALTDDIKSGPGGIREIEFIVQTFQLIRGGRDPALRARGLLETLPLLARQGLIASRVASELEAAYRYLRSLENRLQSMHDRQTHALPIAPLERSRLTAAMGCTDWAQLTAALAKHRSRVARHFARTVFGPPEARRTPAEPRLAGVWDGSADAGEAAAVLARAGIHDPPQLIQSLSALRKSGFYRRMDETARDRLDRLVPNLLLAIARLDHQALAWRRLEQILEAVARRSAYLALLNENPLVLERLAGLCAQSGFVARQVANYPLLLDELLDPRIFELPPTREQFAADLDMRLGRADADLEQQLEALGRFQRAAVFRVAVADLGEILPLMRISDLLTDIAELTIERALALAWKELVARHGRPMCESGGERRPVGFAIIGYGKLGGLELGYSSDLDLVFVHDSSEGEARTDGPASLDNAVFFARLGRRVIHLLSAPTRSGVLYDIDMRLRPSGNAGLLVSSLASFRSYQEERAWTWEHQALTRSRAVAGDAGARAAFEDARREILQRHVDHAKLARRVRRMRERMRKELARGGGGRFDIKQDRGGLADLEFLVQYWVLRGARDEPALVQYSDNIRQLEALARARCIGEAAAHRLTEVYLAYRQRLHRIALDEGEDIVADDEFRAERAYVGRIWRASLEADSSV